MSGCTQIAPDVHPRSTRNPMIQFQKIIQRLDCAIIALNMHSRVNEYGDICPYPNN